MLIHFRFHLKPPLFGLRLRVWGSVLRTRPKIDSSGGTITDCMSANEERRFIGLPAIRRTRYVWNRRHGAML